VRSRDAIAEGRQAWQQIRQRSLSTWTNWLSVGHALIAGRNAVMRDTGCNRPVGGTYNRRMGEWLVTNGFADISTQERYSAAKCAESESAIEQWREGLTDVQRRRYQSANANLNYWKRATRQQTSSARGPHNGKSGRIVALEAEIARLTARIVELEDALRLRDQLGAMFTTKDEIHAFAPTA
jgi:hypothetical protein